MSFSLKKVAGFASRVKDTVASNVSSIVQNNPSLSHAGASIKEGFSGLVSSVKSTSAAVGKQIADTMATKPKELMTISIRGSEVSVILNNLGCYVCWSSFQRSDSTNPLS